MTNMAEGLLWSSPLWRTFASMYRPLQSIPRSRNRAIDKSSFCNTTLRQDLSVHGLPYQVISKNDPPFNSTEFARYMDMLGIQFDPTTPKWPQGNAEVEHFMQPLGKAIQTAHAEIGFCYNIGRDLTQRPKSHLLNYYSTLLDELPILHPHKVINKHKQAQTKDKERRECNKQYTDRKSTLN